MGAFRVPRVRRFAPEILPHNTRAGALRGALPTSKFRLWELFSLHVFGASRLKLVKFFRTTHMRERCALPTSKFRLWERFSLHVFVRRFAPEILPHNTRAGAQRAPHVQISPVGALRAPHFWRCAPGIFPHTSPAGALRAPHIQISPVTALCACGAHRQVLYQYLDHVLE